jgi:hypothetical protein
LTEHICVPARPPLAEKHNRSLCQSLAAILLSVKMEAGASAMLPVVAPARREKASPPPVQKDSFPLDGSAHDPFRNVPLPAVVVNK